MHRRHLLVFLVSIVALGGLPSASGATFFNGSFESPGAPFLPWDPGLRYLGDEQLDPADLPGTGWVHAGTAIPASQFGDFYTNGQGGLWTLPPVDGNYFIGFGASGFNGGVLSQTFDTVVGATYWVNYALTTLELFTGPYPAQEAFVEVLDSDDVQLASALNFLPLGPPAWGNGITLVFTATTTSTTLRFTDLSGPGTGPGDGTFDINWGLDNVSLSETPEPGTFAVLGVGLGILALIRKRAVAR